MNNYSMYLETHYGDDMNYCKQFLFTYGSNYAAATRLFPRRIREATIIFYAIVRFADEQIDNNHDGTGVETFHSFVNEWNQVFNQDPDGNTNRIIRANYWLFQKYDIPKSYLDDFFVAMESDLTVSRYQTYQDLEQYMWGSASIVGHVMGYIIGYQDSALGRATALGEAMQMANFLRDVDEDYHQRDRIYLPQEYLDQFGVTESMIAGQVMTPELRVCIEFLANKTHDLFQEGREGLQFLNKNGRMPVRIAAYIYEYNLRILAQRNYDVFGEPIRVSTSRKIWIIVLCYLGLLR